MSVTTKMIWARKRRLFSVAVAIVLGVAFLTGSLLIGDTMRATFDDAFADVNAGTDLVVRSDTKIGQQRALIDDSTLAMVAGSDGVTAAAGEIVGTARLLGADGQRLGGGGPPTIGTTWIDDPTLNQWEIVDGRAPAANDEVVIDRAVARAGDLHVGDRTQVLTPGPVDVTITGIATLDGRDAVGPTTMTAFTLDGAREHLIAGQPGLSSIVVDTDDAATGRVESILAQALPSGTEAITGQTLTDEQNAAIESDFLGAFRMMLLGFAGIALIVATFTIHNTFSILVAQRTRESALLRAIGASRRQVLRAVAAEALAVGAVASAVGLAAGYGLATAMYALMNSVGFGGAGSVVVSPVAVVAGFVVGIGTALVASLSPALAASRVAPLAALRDVAVDRSAGSFRRAVLGAVLVTAGGAAIATATLGDNAVAPSGLGAVAIVAGAVVLGPVVAGPAARIIGLFTGSGFTMSGRLAQRNAVRNPKRIAASASALLIGTAVVSTFTVLGSSMTNSFEEVVDESFSGDLVIRDESFMPAIPAGMADEIAALPEVARSVPVAFADVQLAGDDEVVVAADVATLGSIIDFDVTTGSLADVTGDAIAVSTDYADEHGLDVGARVPVTFVDGATAELDVVAVYDDATVMGELLVDHALYAPHAQGLADTMMLVNFADGVDTEAGQAAVTAVTERLGAPRPETRSEYVDSISGQINQLLAIVYGLLAVAVLIAVIGIGNTISLSMYERRRELGLLRAVGQTRRQLRTTVRVEAVIVALFGATGGVAIGTLTAWALVRAMRHDLGFGSFAISPIPIVTILVLSIGAGVVASVRPGRRAARADVLAAIAA